MNAPQIIMIILMVMGFTVHAVKHGEPRTNPFDVRWQLVNVVIMVGLLYWGGFWG